MSERRTREDPWPAIGILAAVWSILLTQPWVARATDPEMATLICFAVATAIVIAPSLPLSVSKRAVLAGVSGFLAGAVLRLGAGALVPESTDRGQLDLMAFAIRGVFAPVFEEMLYREWLMVPFQRRFGTPRAVALTSVLFAVPHLAPLEVVGAFGLGLILGGVRARAGSVAPCIGMHAGWNLGLFALTTTLPGL